MTVEQKQIRSYRGAKFVFLVLCFVTSHRHNAGVPAVYTVFRHVSCYLTTASIPEIIEVTDVPHCQYKINLHTSSTLCVKKDSFAKSFSFMKPEDLLPVYKVPPMNCTLNPFHTLSLRRSKNACNPETLRNISRYADLHYGGDLHDRPLKTELLLT